MVAEQDEIVDNDRKLDKEIADRLPVSEEKLLVDDGKKVSDNELTISRLEQEVQVRIANNEYNVE